MNLLLVNTLRLQPALLALALILLSIISNAQLEYRKALSNTIKIKLPPVFKFMEANVLSTKYLSKNMPTEVYTNEAATVNVAFNKTQQMLKEQKVFTESKKLEQQLTSNGKVQLISSEQASVNNSNISIFSFYSNAIDTKVYNVTFIFSLKGKMVVGSFNCTIALQSQWQSTAYKIIRSIKEI
jgi:hypothetical protein